MKIDVLTLFPAMFAGPLDESIIMRARKKGLLDLNIHQLRDWTHADAALLETQGEIDHWQVGGVEVNALFAAAAEID